MNEDKKNQIHHGRCLCGAIGFQATGAPVIVAHCHCEDCQRLSGAGHSTSAMYSVGNVKITGNISEYELEANNKNTVTRGFCANCSSPIFGRNSGSSQYLTLQLGAFNDSSDFEPQVVVFARNKNPWDLVDETLPTFDTQPDWKPDDGV